MADDLPKRLTPIAGVAWSAPKTAPAPRIDLSKITTKAAAAELMDRVRTRPLFSHRFGIRGKPGEAIRRAAFASNLRGVVYVGGGKRSSKTYGAGAAKTVAIAEGTWQKLCCPADCKCHGLGTCGIHCCPQPKCGGADYRHEGCVAGEEKPCPVHTPLAFDKKPRFILVGCLDTARFWGPIYNDSLKRLLTRNADGTPAWTEDKAHNRIIAKDGSYIIQCVTYDRITRIESWNPCFVWLDELPDYEYFRAAKHRCWDKDTQLFITATAANLLKGQDLWAIHELKQKAPIPEAQTQIFAFSTLDNPFLEGGEKALARVRQEAEMMKRTNEQEYRVCVLGELFARQDTCAFSRRAIENQASNIRDGQVWYTVVTPPSDTTGARARYYDGVTRYPDGCNLPDSLKGEIEISRLDSGHTGTACYDCPRPCERYESPPRLPRADTRPFITRTKPEHGCEWYECFVWHQPVDGHIYALGADMAKGVIGGDYNCIVVFDVTTGEQVFAFRQQCPSTIFAAVLAAVIAWYRNFGRHSVVPESNSMGHMVIHELLNVYGVDSEDVYHRVNKKKRHVLSGEPMTEPGFETTRGTKLGTNSSITSVYGSIPSPMACLNSGLETMELIIHDPTLYSEMQTFVQVDGKLAGLDGTHDDTVIAAILAALGAYLAGRNGSAKPIAVLDDGVEVLPALGNHHRTPSRETKRATLTARAESSSYFDDF